MATTTKQTRNKKTPYDKCEFLKRHKERFPDKDLEGLEEVVTYHSCMLKNAGIECAYPTRFCRFKKEMEDIILADALTAPGEAE